MFQSLSNSVRAIRRKLAVLALAVSLALTPAPAFAQSDSGELYARQEFARRDAGQLNTAILFGVVGVLLLIAIAIHHAENDADDADDAASANPPKGLSLGSFRLSERGDSAHYGATVATVSPTAAQNGMPARMRRASASGLFGALARLPENALAKANASSWAQSGWSFRPALDAAGLRDPDDARFFLQVERAF